MEEGRGVEKMEKRRLKRERRGGRGRIRILRLVLNVEGS